MEFPQIIKNGTAFDFESLVQGIYSKNPKTLVQKHI